ncbi:MAG: ABC transporter ATP-binding protein [Clostridiales Family XIII bacterium]|jgi:simple sugar transport system ATP-binding protein|nr:ABC transporter ATP-binding protein [Clostridiales Family XIII bacterium]
MTNDRTTEYAVEMTGIHKYFGAFCALDDVSVAVEKGTIHALLGENGAGKTTLMNILYGIYKADAGEIRIHGKPCDIKNPRVAIRLGIGMVHQHFMLVENFSVTENIVLGEEVANRFGILDRRRAERAVTELSEKYGFNLDPAAKIEDISVGMQQRVEILKALYRGAEILILDEPTAVLSPQEIEELIGIMRNLTESGKTILIITHKLREIQASADYCTIIRRGRYIDTIAVEGATREMLASKMVGREVMLKVDKKEAAPGEAALSVEGLRVKDQRDIERVKGLSFEVRKGEILGVAGIDGNGQKELVEALTGLRKAESGSIKVGGEAIENTTPRHVIDALLSTIHEDRQRRGMIGAFTVADNFILEKYRQEPFSKKGVLDEAAIAKNAEALIGAYDIRPDDAAGKPMRTLSGGNQQKVIIAREIQNDPDVLVAVQPTRGLDVGAIEYVHKKLVEERDKGKAVLLISYELDEVMNVSDRIVVLYDGQITGEMPAAGADENHIGLLMAGGGAA